MDSGRKQIKGLRKKPGANNKAASGTTPPVAPTTKPVAKLSVGQKTQAAKSTFLQILSGPPTPSAIEMVRYVLMVETLIVLVLALALAYAKFNIPREPIPFAINTKTGKPDQLSSLYSPTKTQQAILSWVGSASADILNFGFHNVYDRLQSTEKYFTDDGWESFKEAIRNSGIVARITEKQQVITAAPVGTPVILSSQDNVQYGHEWTVQVPIYVTVLSGKETDSRQRTLTLILVSVPPEKNITGLAIDRWLETQ